MSQHVLRRERAREGSPWTGMWAVVAKEMADNLTSARMHILELLIALTAVGAVYGAIQEIMNTISEDRFLFLKLFTEGRLPMPAFLEFLGFLVPLLAIAMSFDAINGEFNRRTMSRILAQPIYRDALLFGKFLAHLFTLALVLTAIWLLIIGLGIVRLGLPPSGEEMARLLWFLLATIFYGGIWLALAMVLSIEFRQPATAALSAIAVWLFFAVFWKMIANVLAPVISPVRYGFPEEQLRLVQTQLFLWRLSPNTLYGEIAMALLRPEIRVMGFISPVQLSGAILGTPLPLSQSLLLVWPQMTGLVAATILLFALGYVLFQRQEIRA
ncbi:MAG: ABC transporter permease [Chloroflexi bacterium]|nr:ABC transporter permease [Chloroflexota bacterium]